MAKERTFVCSHCRYLIQAWDGGQPYFRSDLGQPQLFRLPDSEKRLEEYLQQSEGRGLTGKARADFLALRVGTLRDLLCLDCGSRFKWDLEKQEAVCPRRKCGSKNVTATWELKGKPCPSCKTGKFKRTAAVA